MGTGNIDRSLQISKQFNGCLTMAKDKPRNTSASVRQRLLNYSTAIKTGPNLVLIWYGLEL